MQRTFVGRLAMDEMESSKSALCTFCSDVLKPTQKSRPRGLFLIGQMTNQSSIPSNRIWLSKAAEV